MARPCRGRCVHTVIAHTLSFVCTCAGTDTDTDVAVTDIEELKEAAQSIEVLARRLPAVPANAATIIVPFVPATSNTYLSTVSGTTTTTAPQNDAPCAADLPRPSPRPTGITTRLGAHPRGVMQFLPSVLKAQHAAAPAANMYDTYSASKARRAQTVESDAITGRRRCVISGTPVHSQVVHK
jgi:hypothetical protein